MPGQKLQLAVPVSSDIMCSVVICFIDEFSLAVQENNRSQIGNLAGIAANRPYRT
jgi:hypothetical protein